MKIECPECGQHYEVEASMLDRHFRCTECKAFFLGINAKAVKVKKYVPKNSVAMSDAATDMAASEKDAASVDAIEPAQAELKVSDEKNGSASESSGNSDTKLLTPAKNADKNWFDDAEAEAAPAGQSKVKLVLIGGMVILTVFTAVISGAVAWCIDLQSKKQIAELEKRCRTLLDNDNTLLGRIEKLEEGIEKANNEIASGSEKTVKLEQKIDSIQTDLKKLEEIAERMNKCESKDLELNVKLLELSSVVDDLKDKIETTGRNAARNQRKRR